jgi:oligosaccharide repeat unit polymerase
MLNPAILFPMIWICLIALSPIVGMDFYPYSNIFYIYIAISLFVFSMTAMLGGFFSRVFPYKKFAAFRQLVAFRISINIYIIIMILIIILQLIDHYYLIGADWWTPSNIVLYRWKVFEEHEPIHFGWTSWLNFFFFSVLPMASLVPTNIWQKVIIYLLLAVLIFINAARAPILVILLLYYFFDWFRNGFNLRYTLASISIFLLFYFVIAVMTEKVGMQFGVVAYTWAPSHAFDQILIGVSNTKDIELYTFPMLHELLYFFGAISEIPTRNFGFYSTPVPTNVYTIFGPYFLDYGIGGAFLFLAGIGFICGLIYKLAKKKDIYLIFLCSITTSLLCLSVFHDYFTSAGFVWASAFLGFFFFPIRSSVSNRKYNS